MKKKIFTFIFVLFFMAIVVGGCFIYYEYSKGNIPTKQIFTKEEFPKIDASLATQPLVDAIYEDFTKSSSNDLNYTNTHPAYVNLVDGKVDVIIVTEPSKEELEYAKEKNVELEVIPIVNEAFVFFVNKKNKIDNLTIEQIRNIYSGEYTNFNQVGGENSKILAYQRPENSGSQTGMLSLVMKDVKMKKPVTEEYIASMAGIIDIVASFNNEKQGIGYSYYYYANTMYNNENIKFLGINGVKPTYKTIQDKTYPIITNYYAVFNKNEASDSNVRKLVKQILSKRGSKVAKKAGYVTIK